MQNSLHGTVHLYVSSTILILYLNGTGMPLSGPIYNYGPILHHIIELLWAKVILYCIVL